LNTKQLQKLGIPFGEPMHRAKDFIANYLLKGGDRSQVEHVVAEVVGDPAAHLNDPIRGALARSLIEGRSVARAEPVPWKQWGTDLDAQSVEQIENACRLPVSVCAALMPDAHVGYGLPIGGVLATDNAVIPYAVGVDIACRMKMTVLDLPVRDLDRRRDWLREAI
jgi:tRNA-splicing ligase RtcB